jgi:hypothetical protein
MTDEELTQLGELIDRIAAATEDRERVSIEEVLARVGRRSFGPVLLVGGLITLAPVIGDIPGVPTVIGALVFLVGVQLLFHRQHIWLPKFILKRSAPREKLCKALGWMRRPARWIDRVTSPRMTMFTRGGGSHAIAIFSIAIALMMPAMELIPFSANGAGAALTAFGIALIAHDGVVALIALIVTTITLGLVGYHWI